MTLKVLQPKSYNTPVMQKVFVRGFKVTKNGVLKLICIFGKPKSGQIFIFLYCSFSKKGKNTDKKL